MKTFKLLILCFSILCIASCSDDSESNTNVRFYFTEDGVNRLSVYMLGTSEIPILEREFESETFEIPLHLNTGGYYANPYNSAKQISLGKVGFQVQEGRTTIITSGENFQYTVEYR